MMDTATILSELESTRSRLGDEMQTVDEAILAFRKLAGGTAAPAPTRKPTKRGGVSRVARAAKVRKAKKAKAPAAAKKTPKRVMHRADALDDATQAKLKAICADSGIRAAAAATGLNYGRVWRLANAHGWKVAKSPRGGAAVAKKADKSTVRAQLKPGARVCHQCRSMTYKDPCNVCSAPARKD